MGVGSTQGTPIDPYGNPPLMESILGWRALEGLYWGGYTKPLAPLSGGGFGVIWGLFCPPHPTGPPGAALEQLHPEDLGGIVGRTLRANPPRLLEELRRRQTARGRWGLWGGGGLMILGSVVVPWGGGGILTAVGVPGWVH